jgi:hypothetical protein
MDILAIIASVAGQAEFILITELTLGWKGGWGRVSNLLFEVSLVFTTEYTQIGNGNFLVYIPS